MGIDNVIDYVLSKPCNFPGKQNSATIRTVGHQQPVEPKHQMKIVWRALIQHMDDKLRAGCGVNIKGFGAFTFDIDTELPKISHGRQVDMGKDLGHMRSERKNIHHVKPRFVVDDKLQYHLQRYHGKEQIVPAKSQKSIYQKGFRMVFLNPVPVAAAAQMGPDVVKDCLASIFGAIEDLIRQDKDISLQMGFANLRFTNRGLKVHFADYLGKELA